MVAFQIGLAVALLVTGQQVDLQLEPESVAMKQAAAKRFDDTTVDRYLAMMREMQKSQAKVAAVPEGPARDQAEEAALKAAATKVGFNPGELPGIGGLITEWFMATGPTGGPKAAAERKAGFVGRYGKKATAVLEKNDARLKKAMTELVTAGEGTAR
jgi:hypothetical protein